MTLLADGMSAKYFDGKECPAWLQGKLLYIRNVYGKYYDISIYPEDSKGITGRVKEKYLVSLEEPEEETPVKAERPEVGSVIRLADDAVYTTGKAVPDWVRKMTLYLREWVNDSVIAFSVYQTGGITGYVDAKYLVQEEPAGPAPEPALPEKQEPEEVNPQPEKPSTEAPSVPYTVTVTIVEERDGFGRMENGGWIPLYLS